MWKLNKCLSLVATMLLVLQLPAQYEYNMDPSESPVPERVTPARDASAENYQKVYEDKDLSGGIKVDSSSLKTKSDKLDFSEQVKMRKTPQRNVELPKMPQPVWGGGAARTLVYFLAFLTLAVILYVLLSKTLGKRDRGIAEKNVGLSLGTDAQDLENMPLDSMLAEALASGDYHKAIRILYLKILKELFSKGLIYPSSEKTNFDYGRELTGTEFKQGFLETTRYYEQVYYGNYSIAAIEYKALSDKFTRFFHSIRIR